VAGCGGGHATSKVGVISTAVGGGQGGDGGPATSAQLASPTDVACAPHGNLYVLDTGLSDVRRVDANGKIRTVAGKTGGGALFSGDGGPATAAALNGPLSIALAPNGDLYLADSANNRIRRVDRRGTITTVVGTGKPGFSGDGGPAVAAELDDPEAIAFDAAGDLYIDDYENSRIRRVDGKGITTVAGTGEAGFSGDGGPANAAELNEVEGIGFDGTGDLLIADTSNDRIRRVDRKGNISTIAGTGKVGRTGDGGPASAATFHDPVSVVADARGNLYVSDHHNDRIRRIDDNGTITTFAGTGARGFAGDGGPAASAELDQPWALAVCDDTLYIADSFNARVRKVRLGG
jgi:sugar lactone lactonase YvrE